MRVGNVTSMRLKSEGKACNLESLLDMLPGVGLKLQNSEQHKHLVRAETRDQKEVPQNTE